MEDVRNCRLQDQKFHIAVAPTTHRENLLYTELLRRFGMTSMTSYSNNRRAMRFREQVPDSINQLIKERIVYEKLRIAGPIGTSEEVLEDFKITMSSSNNHIIGVNKQTRGVEIQVHNSITTDVPSVSQHTKVLRYVIEPRVKIHTVDNDPQCYYIYIIIDILVHYISPPELHHQTHLLISLSQSEKSSANTAINMATNWS